MNCVRYLAISLDINGISAAHMNTYSFCAADSTLRIPSIGPISAFSSYTTGIPINSYSPAEAADMYISDTSENSFTVLCMTVVFSNFRRALFFPILLLFPPARMPTEKAVSLVLFTDLITSFLSLPCPLS